MLTAHASTTSDDFIAQLRTYVIALGLSPLVVDCVDKLTGVDDLEKQSEEELDEAEAEAREGMKAEILSEVNAWLKKQPWHDQLGAVCEELIKEIEKVKA